jgi:hypothetical protein
MSLPRSVDDTVRPVTPDTPAALGSAVLTVDSWTGGGGENR